MPLLKMSDHGVIDSSDVNRERREQLALRIPNKPVMMREALWICKSRGRELTDFNRNLFASIFSQRTALLR